MQADDRGIQERWLRSFIHVAEAGGYEEAERRFFQPASVLKDDVNRLKRALADVVLLRGRPLQLTPEGATLLRSIRQMAERLQRLHDDADALRRGTVRVRGYAVHVPMIFSEAVARFRSKNADKGITIEFEEATSLDLELAERDLYGPVIAGDVHFAFGGPVDRAGLSFLPVYETKLVAVSYRIDEQEPWRDRRRDRRGLPIEELARLPLVGVGPGTFRWDLIRQYALREDSPVPDVRARLTSAGALMNLLQKGVGVGVMTDDLVKSWTGYRARPRSKKKKKKSPSDRPGAADEGSSAAADEASSAAADEWRPPGHAEVAVLGPDGEPLVLTVGAHFLDADPAKPWGRFLEVLQEVAHANLHHEAPVDGCAPCHP